MEFLSKCLNLRLSPAVSEDIVAGSRASTIRQYQSAWKAFKQYLLNHPITSLSTSVVLDFLSHMFHSRGRAARTVSTYVSALADPLRLGFGLVLDDRCLALMRRSFCLRRHPPKRPPLFWSLRKVLTFLRGPTFSAYVTPLDRLRKTLFLVALASGLRSSQLQPLLRHPSWLVFSADGRQVSRAPSPKFLAKTERLGHSLPPSALRAWMVSGAHHPLCPVGALREYVRTTSRRAPSRLFVWPETLTPLSRMHISSVLCGVIEEADPGKAPKGRDVHAMSASLSFLRHYSVDRVVQEGQWSSDRSFVDHYLDHYVSAVRCASMAGPPSPASTRCASPSSEGFS